MSLSYLRSEHRFASLVARVFPIAMVLVLAAGLMTSHPAFAQGPLSSPAPVPTGNPTPLTATPQGQMMALQESAMAFGASIPADPFEGNVPKSTSLSANFVWADTFDASALNGGYGGGVTLTRWITSHVAVTGSIEIYSFGLGEINNVLSSLGLPHQAGTPVIPITLGGVYDFTGGKRWVNPQVFGDFGPAVTLNGESMPLYVDLGVGIVTPLAKFSDALSGIDLFANARWAYFSNISGLADSAVSAIGAVGSLSAVSKAAADTSGALNFMPIEFGATFVF